LDRRPLFKEKKQTRKRDLREFALQTSRRKNFYQNSAPHKNP